MSILEKIYNAGLKFLTPSTLDEVYKTIVNEAIKLVGVEDGAIYLKDDDTFKAVYATQPHVYKISPRKRGNTYEAFLTQKTIIANVTRSHPELKKTGVKSSIFIPLSYQNKSIGVLTLDSKNREHFDEKKRNTLVLFGSLASLAVRKAQLYDETKQAVDTRDLFISLAAHELRTPLTTINGYIQLLLTKLRNKKTIQPRWIYEIALESNRLKSLIDEFLEINRIRTGQLQFDWKESHLRKIIKRAISTFSFNKPDRKIIFKNRLNGVRDLIIGDRDKLVQVVTNLLENADKYSSRDKDIILTLKYNSPYYLLQVVDKGQGIPEEEISYIFKGFYKGKNSQHEGMGLGLYLSKLIIDQHHGSINIFSEIRKGTRVEIKLPKITIK